MRQTDQLNINQGVTGTKTRSSADAEGPRDAPQIRNIALENGLP